MVVKKLLNKSISLGPVSGRELTLKQHTNQSSGSNSHKAVDNKMDTCARTEQDGHSWWKVVFRHYVVITEVNIFLTGD